MCVALPGYPVRGVLSFLKRYHHIVSDLSGISENRSKRKSSIPRQNTIPFFAAPSPKRLCTEHPPRSLTCQSYLLSGGSNPYQNESAYILRPNTTTISNERMVTRLSPPPLNTDRLPPPHPRFLAGKVTVRALPRRLVSTPIGSLPTWTTTSPRSSETS